MSKLIALIEAQQTGRRFAPPPGPLTRMLEITEDYSPVQFTPLTEYKLRVEIGALVRIKNSSLAGMHLPRDSPFIRTLRHIENEIFGEFRGPLYEASECLHGGDYSRAADLIDGVIKEMFELSGG